MRNFTLFKTARSFLFFFCLLAAGSLQAKIIYVNGNQTSGSHNGTSWANAYSILEIALSNKTAVAGDQIWVAKGTYKPTTSGNYFSLVSGVAVYGGFVGGETSLTQRNWKTNSTVLQGNNTSVLHSSDLNNQTILDGFAITGGNAPGDGGGMWNDNVSMQIRNCVFAYNFTAKRGGGVYNYGSSPTFTNVVFSNNIIEDADGNGGGIYNEGNSSVTLTNAVFYYNDAAIYNNGSKCTVTNCTFLDNNRFFLSNGGPITNYASSDSTATLTIKNSIFSHQYTSNELIVTNGSSAVTNVTYCATQDAMDGVGNVQLPDIYSLFPSLYGGTDPEGPDGIWMTADDDLNPSICGGSSIIDHGSNTAITETSDITGQPRKTDVPLITDGGQGTAPIVDMGAYESQNTTTIAMVAGLIKNAHTIPYPQENFSDSILSASFPAGDVNNFSITWQKNENDGTGWTDVTPSNLYGTNLLSYKIPELTTTTSYRRGVVNNSGCATTYYSNTVTIKVVDPNGAISGRVISKNGTGVKGIAIEIKRNDSISGGPAGFSYYDTTKDDGTYSITPIYYGDPSVSASKAGFTVTPSKPRHGFNFISLTKTLSKNIPQISNVNFTDTTVLSVTGTTYQQCPTCADIASVKCPLDSVSIYNNGSLYGQSTYIGGNHGQYGLSISDPGLYKIKTGYKSHVFMPADTTLDVEDDVPNVNFYDTTTHVISGHLLAGCGDSIGTAILEFSDTLPNDINGSRPSCFIRDTVTGAGGFFHIRLPARVYRVSVKSFTPTSDTSDVTSNDITSFFNNNAKTKDMLVRDITTHDTTLELVYHRPPVLSLTGLKTVCTTPAPFAIMHQGIEDSFTVQVYEGATSHYCPLTDTTTQILVQTDIDTANKDQYLYVSPTDPPQSVTLTGAEPQTDSPYFRHVNVQFTDRWGKMATAISKNVVVTGVKANIGTFVTVTPQVPLMVLHDPPGDGSSSTWSSTTTNEYAYHLSAAQKSGNNPWLEVKIGTDFLAGLGVETESSLWGKIGTDISVNSTNTTSNETILSVSTTQEVSTSSEPDVTGDDGDIFIGAALNLDYGTSYGIDWDKNTCAVTKTKKMIVANQGFPTQYIYTTRQIRDVEIPTLKELAASGNTSDSLKRIYTEQVNVWQQVLDNNAKNKANGIFDKNISFDGSAGPITNSTTTDTTTANTIQFELEMDTTIAAELGLEIAGSGVSGGVRVNFQSVYGNDSTHTTTKSTTMSYTLDDDDPGDYFSVDVLKDPVYHSPMFRLHSGTSSCPWEDGTQPRDEPGVEVPNGNITGVDPSGTALVTMYLHNYSESEENRTYDFSLDPVSNGDGAIISINGSPVSNQPLRFTIPFGTRQKVTIGVKKEAASEVYSYTNLRFIMTDDCGGDVADTGIIHSVDFLSPCSSITLAKPENGYKVNAAANNIVPVEFTNYTASNLQSVELQYEAVGTGAWASTGYTKYAADLANSASVYDYNWPVNGLPDGDYNLRVLLSCSNGGSGATVYSQPSVISIDRVAPSLFGQPEPTDDRYARGDEISFKYDESLDIAKSLNNISLIRLSNKQTIPFTASGHDNQVIIVPSTPLSAFAGDSILVVVKGITDLFGNVKAVPDSNQFIVDIPITSTDKSKSVNLSVFNNPILYNADGTMNVTFRLGAPAIQDVVVNYFISGTAVLDSDYTAILPDTSNVYSYDGSQGTIVIPKDSTVAILKFDPLPAKDIAASKTITISLNSGGDYTLGDTASVTGTIIYNGVLPLTLVSFTAAITDDKTNLLWQTANEVNTSYFIIERSTDGSQFAPILKLNAKGSGNNLYALTDASPATGNNYYRLKTVDNTGRIMYSNVVRVVFAANGLHIVNISPSPLAGNLAKVNVVTDKISTLKLIVLDAVGRQMNITTAAVQEGLNHVPVTFTNLAAGVYFVYAIDDHQRKSNVVQFVKQ